LSVSAGRDRNRNRNRSRSGIGWDGEIGPGVGVRVVGPVSQQKGSASQVLRQQTNKQINKLNEGTETRD